MIYNNHFRLEGQHAILGASQHAWLRYDDEKLVSHCNGLKAKELGTRLHALAAEHISLGIKMPKSNTTLNRYINDCIGYKMNPEVVLYYSDNAFATTDAISFRKNTLRISDLKTGVNPAYKVDKETGEYILEQLEIYAALFCLEYSKSLRFDPKKIDYILRIYQNNEVFEEIADPERIEWVMDRIVHCDEVISKLNNKEIE